MSSEREPPGEKELKQCLEEAGLYEEYMDHDEMLNCYNAIRSSQKTAQREDERRSIYESTDKNCKLLEELKEKNANLTISKLPPVEKKTTSATTKPEEDIVPSTSSKPDKSIKSTSEELEKAEIEEEEEEEEDEDVFWDFSNAPPLKHKPLDIITHEPKYNLPVYCDPKILKLSFEVRSKYIYDFHRSLLDRFYKIHLKSLNPAPWGRPVQENPKFDNGCLDRKAMSFDSQEMETLEEISGAAPETSSKSEIYTSRAGRQTKRKVYVENEEENSKKSKKDEDDDFQVHVKPPTKRLTISKMSNAEVMKRSKLFAGSSPKTVPEMLFDRLTDEDKKRKQTQRQVEQGKSTLAGGSDGGDEDGDNEAEHSLQGTPEEVEIKPQPMTYTKRRVSPLIQGRKPIKKTATPERGKGKLFKTKSQSRSQELFTDDSPEIQYSTVTLEEMIGSSEDKAKCPICSEVFSQDIIEEHASSCGLGMDTESNFKTSLRSNREMIDCSICNKKIPMNLTYEGHVKDCIARMASSKQ